MKALDERIVIYSDSFEIDGHPFSDSMLEFFVTPSPAGQWFRIVSAEPGRAVVIQMKRDEVSE